MILETIAAIATAAGEGGIGIVRISGTRAFEIGERIFVRNSGESLRNAAARQAVLGRVVCDGERIDEALALKFAGPSSYTGEDVLEIQSHGGSMVCRKILQVALAAGARLAEPGEFTKRAFLSGKIDLTQAEAVIGVIRAKTGAALRAANRVMDGWFSGEIKSLRSEILAAVAHIAVAVDYPEDDIEETVTTAVGGQIDKWQAVLRVILGKADNGRLLRDGLRTAILGRPNAGKSSLLNELLGAERAIVTDIPGTTRDTIEETANIGGIPVILVDTAGLRDVADLVEQLGISRSRAAAENAELVIYVIDGSEKMQQEDYENISRFADKVVVVVNKTDMAPQTDPGRLQEELGNIPVVAVSAAEKNGIDRLERQIAGRIFSDMQPEQAALSTARQVDTLRRALESVNNAAAAAKCGMPVDIINVDLQLAWETLGELTGETAGEDILERVFSEFCVGK